MDLPHGKGPITTRSASEGRSLIKKARFGVPFCLRGENILHHVSSPIRRKNALTSAETQRSLTLRLSRHCGSLR